ncbi:EcsC family protein [Peribacillus sp. Hz7]|uniref:EcsC family protein n=1 Tax=Peribacillus sp. Hz7 TaxID=3344873 RepID=UPI0035CA68A8
MENKDQLREELKTIEKWEKDQKGLFFWEKLGRIPFMMLDKVTPKFLHNKINDLLDEVANYIDTGGQYLVNNDATLDKASKLLASDGKLTLEDVQTFPLENMDKVANAFIATRAKNAQIQGATTGIGGIFTLAIDIPLILGLTLKTIQEVAVAYGYDPTDKEERIFMVKCMQFTSSDVVGKKAILEELTAPKREQGFSQLQGWREVFMTYRDNFGWKKLFQMIPIAGMIFGAYMNKTAIQDVGEAANMLYKKRRVLERLERLDNLDLLITDKKEPTT